MNGDVASIDLRGLGRARLALAVGATLVLVLPALAQTPDGTSNAPSAAPPPAASSDFAPVNTAAPTSVAPSAPVDAASAPVGQPTDAGPTAAAPSGPPPGAGSVGVQSLATLDLFSAGRETGLGTDLWKGSSADVARAVIPTLAAATLSPAAAALARDLLATAATAPDEAGDDAALAAQRVRTLLDLGDAEGAGMILDRTPGLSNSAALSQTAADVDLITDQTDKACAVADALSVDRDAVYWLRLRAFCQARAGKPDMAQLTVTLANQQAPDPVFGRLMGAIIGGGAPGAPSLRNGLDYAMSTQLKLDLTPALSHAAPPIARRLAAMAPPPPPPPAAAAPDAAGALAGTPPPVAPPPVVAESDVLARLRGPTNWSDYVAAAKTAQPDIAGLVQAKAALTAPVALASAAIVTGDLADADAIRAGLTQDQIPGASATDLAILDAMLGCAHGKADGQTLDRLVERGEKGDADSSRAQGAAALMAALGGPMGPQDRAAFAGFGLAKGAAPFARLFGMDLAAGASLKGETALLALSIAENAGAAGPGVADRAAIVQALARAGLGGEARAFAVEGLAELQSR